jgi:hypothetical protein
MSVLKKLTEGIVERSLAREGDAVVEKWERTGLLEGIGSDHTRNSMARLLENQAAQLLREASSMAGGDVEGFASVAFPIVRRVFGGLIANDLVSVQPMSLPSGLIFFMDFTFTDGRGSVQNGDVHSLYGGGRVGKQLTGGIDLGETTIGEAEQGFYALNNGYSSPMASTASVHFGTVSGAAAPVGVSTGVAGAGVAVIDRAVRYDPDLSGSTVALVPIPVRIFESTVTGLTHPLNRDNLIGISYRVPATNNIVSGSMVRRLTQFSQSVATGVTSTTMLQTVWVANAGVTAATLSASLRTSAGAAGGVVAGHSHTFHYPTSDNFVSDTSLGAIRGAAEWLLESDATTVSGNFSNEVSQDIPEIDIRVDSVAVTAITKKLKAKWTPELGQDLNAYHNLDAEVELTSILSEQIALEIDREILNDLVQGAKAEKYYWSRKPGKFLNRDTGSDVTSATAPPDFTGTVSEWYETLVETINDVSAQIHRKTLRGGANFLVTSPEVANILEFTSGFRANVTADADKGTVGAVNVGSMSKKWDVWVDPYFPRNLVLVGRKGGSFLESGYVYAPYVPLQVTPTIFGTEDFVPRKGVMTRYAKKMVRPDMYGLVVIQDLLG